MSRINNPDFVSDATDGQVSVMLDLSDELLGEGKISKRKRDFYWGPALNMITKGQAWKYIDELERIRDAS